MALQDIELSFLAGYPLGLAYKLHERKGKCLKELKKYNNAALSMKECIDSIAQAKMDDDKKEMYKKKLMNFINELPKGSSNAASDDNNESSILLPKISNPNKKFPAFSDAIQLKNESGRGRFGVASRDIKLGKEFVITINIIFKFGEDRSHGY